MEPCRRTLVNLSDVQIHQNKTLQCVICLSPETSNFLLCSFMCCTCGIICENCLTKKNIPKMCKVCNTEIGDWWYYQQEHYVYTTRETMILLPINILFLFFLALFGPWIHFLLFLWAGGCMVVNDEFRHLKFWIVPTAIIHVIFWVNMEITLLNFVLATIPIFILNVVFTFLLFWKMKYQGDLRSARRLL